MRMNTTPTTQELGPEVMEIFNIVGPDPITRKNLLRVAPPGATGRVSAFDWRDELIVMADDLGEVFTHRLDFITPAYSELLH